MKKIRSFISKVATGENPDFVTWCFPFIGLLILILIPILLAQNNFAHTGRFTPDNMAGPIIAFVAALLCFLACWKYLKIIKTQEAGIENKESEFQPGQVDKRFYELLNLHRENVSEIRVNQKVAGRKTFEYLFCEYKFCYLCLRSVYTSQKELRSGQSILSEQDLMNISYIVFFMGIGNSQGNLKKNLLKQYDAFLIDKFTSCLKKLQKKHQDEGQLSILSGDSLYDLKLKYKPFCGHIMQLEHYYRHLFQTVKYIADQDEQHFKNKYDRLKTLRAQLSGHEQLMLYYNSLTILGKPWLENKYFTEYRMIKNLPLPLADFGEKPKDKLGELNSKGELLFEWDEISFRNKYKQPDRPGKEAS